MNDVKGGAQTGSALGLTSAQKVLSFLLGQVQPASRPEIALACDLSRPTVFAAIERLTDLGLVSDVGHRVGLPGRSASLYDVAPRTGTVIGVDIGGSNIRVAVADARGRLMDEAREPTSGTGGPAIAQQVVDLVRRLTGGAEATDRSGGAGGTDVGAATAPAGAASTAVGAATTAVGAELVIGVSVPGVIDPDGGTVHYAWNIGQPGPFDLRTPLEDALQARVVLDNNVNLAAVGEQWQGAAQHLRTFAVVAVGAGVGAGIVHEGRLLRGAHGAAGEVAFLPLSPDYQRRRAASPDEAGGLVLLRMAQAAGGWQGHPPVSVEELFERAARGEAPAVALVEQESRRIAAITASICAVIDPETVILAGGVGANEALVRRTGELVNELAPFPPAVVRSALGDRASLVGAMALAVRRTQDQLVALAGDGGPNTLSRSAP